MPLHRGGGASTRRQPPSLLTDASGGDERHRVDRRHLDDITGVWGMDHEPLSDVDADVADRAVEEDQIAWLQVGLGDRDADLSLRGRDPGQSDTRGSIGTKGQTGAIPRPRPSCSPHLGPTDLVYGEGDRLAGAAPGEVLFDAVRDDQ